MTLKKTIAGYLKPDGTWEPQRDIEMHLLEENATRREWDLSDVMVFAPVKPSQLDEHEWLINHGTDYVRSKRQEYEAAYKGYLPKMEQAQKISQEAHNAWHEHVNLCVANGCNPDIFEGDARLKLKMPQGK